MNRRIFLTLLCLLDCFCLLADPVTPSQAREKASQFLNKRVAMHARRSAPAAAALKMMAIGRDDSYYIFNVGDDGGYVVVSGEDATEEILGYSDTGHIDPDNMPCNMRMLFDNYAEQIKYLRDNGITREQNRSPRKSAKKSFHVDESRLAKYAQSEPYNNMCPRLGNGDLCVTGCAATAMAELMYYYKWPSQTTCEIPGYLSEVLDKDNETVIFSSQIDAIPAHTTIDWDNILKQYNTYYAVDLLGLFPDRQWDTNDQADAIASLMKMAGASVHTSYWESSSATNYNIPYALKKYFGYSSANLYNRSCYTDEEWNNKLCHELEKNKPILYFGHGSEGGHFFMLEGYQYDDDYYYDINFGWDGRKNGEFLLTLVKNNFTYTDNQAAVLDVIPQSTLSPIELPLKLTTDELNVISTDVYERSLESGKFENITLEIQVSNKSPIDTKFNYGFMFKNGAIVDDCFFDDCLEIKSTFGIGGSIYFSCGSNLFDGKYTILAISKEEGTDIWFQNDNSENKYVEAWVCNDKLSLRYTGIVSAQLNCSEFTQTSETALRVGQTSEFGFILTNITSPVNYNGGILIKDVESDQVIHLEEVELSGLGSKRISFLYTPSSSGEHKLMILNKRWEEIGRQTVNVIPANEPGDSDRTLVISFNAGGAQYGLYTMQDKDDVVYDGDNTPHYRTAITLDVTRDGNTTSYAVGDGLYKGEDYVHWATAINQQTNQIFIFTNSSLGWSYALDGYCYVSQLDNISFSKETVFTKANWGWHPYFTYDNGVLCLNHFSFAGYYAMLSTRNSDGTWSTYKGYRINPDEFIAQSEQVGNVLVIEANGSEQGVEGIAINETNFPDEKFRNWVLSQDYGQDGVLTNVEIAGVTEIAVYWQIIKSLKGIEYFTALTALYCNDNQLTELDVSRNTALTELSCANNHQLTSLDVSRCTALRDLSCSHNQLTSLDVSGCAALEYLDCHNNQLTSLDVSKNTALTTLYCDLNLLTSLDVSKNAKLERLSCEKNQLTSLDVSGCTALKYLECYKNQIKDAEMDALVKSLPKIKDGILTVICGENEQNVMTTTQVAAAKAKGWTPYYLPTQTSWDWERLEYEGSEPSIEIEPIIESTEMAFGGSEGFIGEEIDLNSVIVNNTYITLDAENGDGYDALQQAVVLKSTTTEEQMSVVQDAKVGDDVVRDNYNGIIFEVSAGSGTISVDAQTIGSYVLNIQIGKNKPTEVTKVERGLVEVRYNVTEPTYVYLYASSAESSAARRSVAENSVLLYGYKVSLDDMILGDGTGDGVVDISDYIGVANHILGIPQTGFNADAADVNKDGVIDISDYIGVANIILTGKP